MVTHMKSFIRHPFASAVFAVAAIIIGLIASLYHDEVLSAWPFPYFQPGPIGEWGGLVPQAMVFWVLILLFMSLFGFREIVRASDNEVIRRGFHEKIDEIKLITETTPPKDFLRQYDELCGNVIEASANAIRLARRIAESGESTNIDPLSESSRFILDCMLQLATRWDTTTDLETIGDRTYRANVMWCHLKENVADENQRSELLELSKTLYSFEDQKSMMDSADGFLKVDLDLATKERTDGEIDREIDDLMLTFDLKGGSKSKKKTRNLAGAPISVVTGEMSYVGDTSQMSEFAKEQKGFSPDELSKIESNYAGDDKGRSIISLPVPFEFSSAGYKLPMAIINLYRDYAGIMGSEERAKQFAHLMTPLVGGLRSLIVEMKGGQ